MERPNVFKRTAQRIENGIHNSIQKGADRKLSRIMQNPQRHKREIAREFERAYLDATKTPVQDAARARRDALQLIVYPVSHIPLPIALLTLPTNPITPVVPILLSSAITTVLYNIPNTHQALLEHRWAKAAAYTGVTALATVLPIPIVLNTITYDVFARPIQGNATRKIMDHAQDVLAHPENFNPEHYSAFADTFSHFLHKKRRRGSVADRLERAEVVTYKQEELLKAQKEQAPAKGIKENIRIYRNFRDKRLREIVGDKAKELRLFQSLIQAVPQRRNV